jgi:hypothetical protein
VLARPPSTGAWRNGLRRRVLSKARSSTWELGARPPRVRPFLDAGWYGTVVMFAPSPEGRRHADLTTAGLPWPSSLAGVCSRVPRGSTAAQQGPPLPGRPPPRTEEIIAVMRCCGDGVHGARARGLIVVLWRAGRCPVELHQYAGASSGSVELVPDAGSSREALVARRDALRAAFAAWLRVRRIRP